MIVAVLCSWCRGNPWRWLDLGWCPNRRCRRGHVLEWR